MTRAVRSLVCTALLGVSASLSGCCGFENVCLSCANCLIGAAIPNVVPPDNNVREIGVTGEATAERAVMSY